MSSDVVVKRAPQALASQDQFKRETLENWSETVDTDNSKLQRLARIIILIIFGFGGVWAVFAPLGGAIVTQGRVVAVGKNRVIQHLEGGILEQLKVREGDKVSAGQVVARLDKTRINAQLQSLRLQKAIARISLARGRAEMGSMHEVSFPPDIDPAVATHPTVLETVSSQNEEFLAQYNYRKAGREIISARIRGQRGDIEGLNEVLKAMSRQLELYEVELADYQTLLLQGAIDRTRVFATERQVVNHKAQIARTRLDIKAAENNIETLGNEQRQTTLRFLQDAASRVVLAQREISRIDGSLARVLDMLDRADVVSPDNGTVFRIAKQTVGSVVRAGEPIMEIYPDDDLLTVEAQLAVRHREKVFEGQEAAIVFPSTRAKATVQFPATLTFLSPDSVVSEGDPIGSYIIRVTAETPEDIPDLLPGNTAQIYIKTKPQTFLDILAGPLKRFGDQAFTD
jgi:HlyD family type I secretion membrane fusion protein